MRIFISYSLGQTDQHVAGLLAQQAQAKGFQVDSTPHARQWDTTPTQTINQSLLAADVVIAIVSKDSPHIATAQHELNAAVNLKRPVIALVERGTAAFFPIPGLPYVEFDRYDLGPALANIGQNLEAHKNKQNLGSWIVVGGLAVLALYLLGSEDKT
jgi:hypothetical protein